MARFLRALVLAVACASDARAEGTGVSPGLNWVRLPGAEECLGAAALAERVEQRAGRVLFVAASEAELFVDGYVARTPSGFSVTLHVSRRDGYVLGERVLELAGERCDVIDEAVTLVVAVTLYPRSALLASGIPLDDATAASLHALFGDEPTDPDPSALSTGAQPTVPAPTREPSATATPAVQTSARLDTTDAERWQVALDAGSGGGIGQLPELGVPLALTLRVTPPGAWPLELRAERWLQSTARLSDDAGEVDFDRTALGLSACPWEPLRAARVCAGAELGLLAATPRALEVAANASEHVLLDATLGLVVRPRLWGALHLRVAAFAAVPLLRTRFVYQAIDGTTARAFSGAPVTGRVDLGVGLDF